MPRIYPQFILCVLLAGGAQAHALTWSLAGGSENWPANERNQIIASMNEAVGIYNANGFFDKHVTANYNPGVPTAQASYSGWIDFGGQRNTRTAMHEIAHTLGVGQYWNFDSSAKNHTNALLKLYDGQNAIIGTGGSHFWPYGLNYDNEDGRVARIRHCRLVGALRRDMGIVGDSDADGLSDDWETWRFGNLAQGANGDPDGDGITNIDEYNTDSDPNQATAVKSGRSYTLTAKHSGKLAEVASASTADGANVQQWPATGAAAQKWTAYPTGGGWWKLVSVNSNKCLQVSGSSYANGGNVDQSTYTGSLWQQWRIVDHSGGYWSICNRASGKVACVAGPSTADGANVHQWTDLGYDDQVWTFTEVLSLTNNAVYSMTALHSSKVADVQWPNTSNGANIGQWDWNGGNWQKWRAEDLGGGYVRLVSVNSGLVMEIAGASTANGGNLQQWPWSGHACQQWRLEGVDALGTYRVINRHSGLVLDVDGVSTANGANIHQWSWWGSNNQKWRFDLR